MVWWAQLRVVKNSERNLRVDMKLATILACENGSRVRVVMRGPFWAYIAVSVRAVYENGFRT